MTTEEPGKINQTADVVEGQDPGATPDFVDPNEPGVVGDDTVGVPGEAEDLPAGDADQHIDPPTWEDSDDDLDDSAPEKVDDSNDDVVLGEAVDE